MLINGRSILYLMEETHSTKHWIVTLMALEDGNFKVTKRLPDLFVSETKIFKSNKDAKKQFDEWLS